MTDMTTPPRKSIGSMRDTIKRLATAISTLQAEVERLRANGGIMGHKAYQLAYGHRIREAEARATATEAQVRELREALQTCRDYVSDTIAGVDPRPFKTMATDDLARIDALLALSPKEPSDD